MKHRPLALDLGDPEMIAARARVAAETAALQQASAQRPTDDWEWRIAQARTAVAPAAARGFWFVPGNKGKFEILAITDADFKLENEP